MWTQRNLLEEETHQQKNHQQIRTEEGEGGSGSHTNVTQDVSGNTTKLVKKLLSTNNWTRGREKPQNLLHMEEPAPTQPAHSCTTENKGWGTEWPTGGKDPPKKDPTTTKDQRHTQSQHKPQPKTSKLGRTRRLYHWISQVFYHKSLHHKSRGKQHSNLRGKG